VSDSIDTKLPINCREFILSHFPFYTRLGGVMLITTLKLKLFSVGAIIDTGYNRNWKWRFAHKRIRVSHYIMTVLYLRVMANDS